MGGSTLRALKPSLALRMMWCTVEIRSLSDAQSNVAPQGFPRMGSILGSLQ